MRIEEDNLNGKRLLDFGSGCGSSAMVLNRMSPDLMITGVELKEKYVEAANLRTEFYGNEDKVSFIPSSDPSTLPRAGGGEISENSTSSC